MPVKKVSAKSRKFNSKTNGNGYFSNFFHHSKGSKHPVFKQKLTLGQKAADVISYWGGSWTFVVGLLSFILIWMAINTIIILFGKWDPYPFILLNLFLSCLSAFQAPIILMSQNREAERDRIDAKYDHQVNRKAEREIQDIQKDLEVIKKMIRNLKK